MEMEVKSKVNNEARIDKALAKLLKAQREAIPLMRNALPTVELQAQREECDMQIHEIEQRLDVIAQPAYERIAEFLKTVSIKEQAHAIEIIDSYRKVLRIYTEHFKSRKGSMPQAFQIDNICELIYDAPGDLTWTFKHLDKGEATI